MKLPPKEISAAEWEIIHAVWQAEEPVTVRQVLDQTYPNGEKAYTTVMTLMNILVDKGFLSRSKQGRVNYYAPAIRREEVLRGSLANIAQRMFQGSWGAMASFLVHSVPLTSEELEDLKKTLDKQGGKQ